MPTLTRVAPELPVSDVAEAMQHYRSKLGFEAVMTMPAGDYAIVGRDGVVLHLFQNEGGLARRPLFTYLRLILTVYSPS